MKGLFTSRPYRKGSVIYTLYGPVTDTPTQTSIKVGEGEHIEDAMGAYINHNCDPSARIEGKNVVAIRDLHPDEEVTFNYSHNEDELVVPFLCSCCGIMIS